MAEGGTPLEPEGKEPLKKIDIPLLYEEIESLDMLFARDLVTYVMKRQIPGWSFELLYGRPCPVTPFSYRIRNAVEFYLVKESVNLYLLFNKAFLDEALDYDGFTNVMNHLVVTVFKMLGSPTELLRLLCVYTHFALLAYKQGVDVAPFYAFRSIQELLDVYREKTGFDPEYFYRLLGNEAERMMHEPSKIDFNDIF